MLDLLYSVDKNIVAVFLTALLLFILYLGFRMIEMLYVFKTHRPLYRHFYLKLRKLTPEQKAILEREFSFYQKLTPKEQSYFEHRLVNFIEDKDFIGRDALTISDQHKVLIGATGVMLTFGFRDYFIGLIDKIFVYPSEYYSHINDTEHKGEFNPKLKALVLSWEDFMFGYDIANDNLNLGIHEFSHAIFFNSRKERDVSSSIFQDSYKELMDLLSNNEALRKELISTRYFRDYAYTNQFEFLAVVIESFIESPEEIRNKFPDIYAKVKQMLNFDFAGY